MRPDPEISSPARVWPVRLDRTLVAEHLEAQAVQALDVFRQAHTKGASQEQVMAQIDLLNDAAQCVLMADVMLLQHYLSGAPTHRGFNEGGARS